MFRISEQSKWQKLPLPSRSWIIFDVSEQLLGVFVSLDLPCGRVWWQSWFVSWSLLHVPLGWAQDIHSLHLAMCSIQELSKIKFYATRLEAKIKFYIGGTSFTFQNEGHYYRLKWLSSYVTSLDLYRVLIYTSHLQNQKGKQQWDLLLREILFLRKALGSSRNTSWSFQLIAWIEL